MIYIHWYPADLSEGIDQAYIHCWARPEALDLSHVLVARDGLVHDCIYVLQVSAAPLPLAFIADV